MNIRLIENKINKVYRRTIALKILKEDLQNNIDEGFFSRFFGKENEKPKRSPEEEKRLKDKLEKIKSGELPLRQDLEKDKFDQIYDEMSTNSEDIFDELDMMVPWDQMTKEQKIEYIKKYGRMGNTLKENIHVSKEKIEKIIQESIEKYITLNEDNTEQLSKYNGDIDMSKDNLQSILRQLTKMIVNNQAEIHNIRSAIDAVGIIDAAESSGKMGVLRKRLDECNFINKRLLRI